MNIEIKELEEKRQKLKDKEKNITNQLYNHYNDTGYDYEEADYIDRGEEDYYNSPEYALEVISMEINEINEKIGLYKRTEFLKNNIVKLNKKSTKNLHEDYLNRTDLAKVIADLIKLQKEDDKLSIGLLGEWGSGKSTFLHLIRKQLDSNSNIIEFNASKYDDQEQIWYSLLLSVSEKYLSNKKIYFKKISFILKSFFIKKRKSLIIKLFVLPVFFTFSTAMILNYIYYSQELSFLLAALSGISTIVTGILSVDLLRIVYNTMGEYFSSNKKKFMKQLKYPSYKTYLGSRENVRKDLIVFKELIEKQTESENSGKNLIIMVDELDRCSDTTIINFFSSIEAFIDIPGITFLFSINPEIVYPVVAKSIPQRKFGKTESEKINQIKLGSAFIDKYINIFVTLPIVSSYDSYIKEILIDIIDEDIIEKIIKLMNLISKDKKTTPREIKKLLDMIIIYNSDFPDVTLLEFSTMLIMKYYYVDYLKLFDAINPHSNVPLKELHDSKFKLDNTHEIPKIVIFCMRDLLSESTMNSITNSMDKISRILLFI